MIAPVIVVGHEARQTAFQCPRTAVFLELHDVLHRPVITTSRYRAVLSSYARTARSRRTVGLGSISGLPKVNGRPVLRAWLPLRQCDGITWSDRLQYVSTTRADQEGLAGSLEDCELTVNR